MSKNLTIYKASAGSGKTFNLALQYIKLLLGVKNSDTGAFSLNSKKYTGKRESRRHRHILAITFTNKATEEMKERIIKELKQLATLPQPGEEDSKYAPRLIADFGCSREELAKAASDALSELLFDYGNFNVSTIDAFFQQVLRTFAREVDRQGDYEVELNTKDAVSYGIGMMLDDFNYGTPKHARRLEQWIYDSMMDRIKAGKSFNILNRQSSLFNNIVEAVNDTFDETFQANADQIRQYLDKPELMASYKKALREKLQRLINVDKTAIRLVYRLIEQEDQTLSCLKPATIDFLRDIENGNLPDESVVTSAGVKNFLEWQNKTKNHLFNKAGCRIIGIDKKGKTINEYPSDQVCEAIEQCVAPVMEHYYTVLAIREVLQACEKLEFVSFTDKYIEDFRQQNNILLLADTNELLHRIIGGDDTPFIYERMGVDLRHFLIDEFQDTSRLQWQNLKPLLAESLASGNDNLIIGDEKQAIYRFRNSDASMLHSDVANIDFPDNANVMGDEPGQNTNYRSAPGIVRFNNTVFSRLGKIFGNDTYDNVVQSLPGQSEPDKGELPAYIRVRLPKAVSDDKQGKNDKQCKPDKNDKNDKTDKEIAIALLAEDILRQHQMGYRWCDIAVLTRKNKELADIAEVFMRDYPQIKLTSDEALYLENANSVKIIVGLLSLIDRGAGLYRGGDEHLTPSDTAAMIARFNFYVAGDMDPELALQAAIGDSLSGAVANSLDELHKTHASSLVALIETIVDRFIPQDRRAAEMAYITAFEDLALEYGKKYVPSVHNFMQWWKMNGPKQTLPAPPDADAVQLLTIHKAKGLEWDCVHLPFMNVDLYELKYMAYQVHPKFEGIPDEVIPPVLTLEGRSAALLPQWPFVKEATAEVDLLILDSLNMAYVAFTRACRELSVIAFARTKDDYVTDPVATRSSRFGPYLLTALQEDAICDSAPAKLLVETRSAQISETPLEFVFGRPTKPDPDKLKKIEQEQAARQIFEQPDYVVYERDDTREFVSMPDLNSQLDNIDELTDEPAEIVDKIPDDLSAEDRRKMEAAAARGNFLHAVMARMNSRDDLITAFNEVLAAASPAPECADEYLDLLQKAFNSGDPRIDAWYDPGARVITEQSILLTNGDILRPDRIVVHTDGTVDLVDFKFTSGLSYKHQDQLRRYCEMLRDMGYRRVRGHLWYPLLPHIATEQV